MNISHHQDFKKSEIPGDRDIQIDVEQLTDMVSPLMTNKFNITILNPDCTNWETAVELSLTRSIIVYNGDKKKGIEVLSEKISSA